MRSRIGLVIVGLAAAAAGAACRKEEPRARKATEPPAPVPVTPDAAGPAGAPVGEALDAAVPPDADLTAVEWPVFVDQEEDSRDRPLSATFQVNISSLKFRSKPPAIARMLNARVAEYMKVSPNLQEHHGTFWARCQAVVVNRYAVILECGMMVDARTREEVESGTGGAPGGYSPTIFAMWLQPGLPEIEIGQLAPPGAAAAAIKAGLATMPSDCMPEMCEFKPASFTIDGEGLVFRPTQYCRTDCVDDHPIRLPLDALKPTHPWAVLLVDRIRARVDALQSLVEDQAAQTAPPPPPPDPDAP